MDANISLGMGINSTVIPVHNTDSPFTIDRLAD